MRAPWPGAEDKLEQAVGEVEHWVPSIGIYGVVFVAVESVEQWMTVKRQVENWERRPRASICRRKKIYLAAE